MHESSHHSVIFTPFLYLMGCCFTHSSCSPYFLSWWLSLTYTLTRLSSWHSARQFCRAHEIFRAADFLFLSLGGLESPLWKGRGLQSALTPQRLAEEGLQRRTFPPPTALKANHGKQQSHAASVELGGLPEMIQTTFRLPQRFYSSRHIHILGY